MSTHLGVAEGTGTLGLVGKPGAGEAGGGSMHCLLRRSGPDAVARAEKRRSVMRNMAALCPWLERKRETVRHREQ